MVYLLINVCWNDDTEALQWVFISFEAVYFSLAVSVGQTEDFHYVLII